MQNKMELYRKSEYLSKLTIQTKYLRELTHSEQSFMNTGLVVLHSYWLHPVFRGGGTCINHRGVPNVLVCWNARRRFKFNTIQFAQKPQTLFLFAIKITLATILRQHVRRSQITYYIEVFQGQGGRCTLSYGILNLTCFPCLTTYCSWQVSNYEG